LSPSDQRGLGKDKVKLRQPSGHFRSKKFSKKELTCHFNEIRHGTDTALAAETAVSGSLSRDSHKATPANRNKQQTTKQK
jgi:hypothetical protein